MLHKRRRSVFGRFGIAQEDTAAASHEIDEHLSCHPL